MTEFALLNARLLDLDGECLTPPTTVLVRGARIAAVGAPAPEDMPAHDLAGKTLMPGMIESHFHVVAHSLDLWANALAPDSLSALRAARAMEQLVTEGFTTVRDLGGADIGLVRAVDEGLIDGPDLVICGKGLSMTGGHCDIRARTDARPNTLEWRVGSMGILVDGVDEARRASRKMLKEGARFIKIMANGGVASPNDPIDSLQYSDDEIRAIVEEAGNAGTYVSAHTYSDASIRRCARLGVKSLEHCNLIGEETAAIAAELGCVAVPTLAAYEGLKRDGAALGLGVAEQAKIDVVRDGGLRSLAVMRDAGLPMAYGTDLIGPLRKYSVLEFELLARVLRPAEILRSLTVIGAGLCRMEGEVGVVAPGARANLIVVDGDPMTDVTVLGRYAESLIAVLRDGRVARGALPAAA
ncbi:MAG: peptidase M38 [Rhodovulum sulfidophilum]|uniref:Peptidase M38 n=1 Tax=Rhodovulum sulfidophilum TaxID=35806 RepID=A0A2W5N3U9_RHOSU|nr:MAG: peptidase M38 [Rhodovulum sulfidophilum]